MKNTKTYKLSNFLVGFILEYKKKIGLDFGRMFVILPTGRDMVYVSTYSGHWP